MPKKHRRCPAPGQAAAPRASAPVRPRPARADAPKPTAGRRRWARVALALVVPLGTLGTIEGLLRVVGVGWPTAFFLRLSDGPMLAPNRRFTWRFMRPGAAPQPYPVLLPARKPAGTFRLFVLGESAAQGTPAPAFGFARILEVLLQQQYPDRRFEVLNVAMRGINSHLVRCIAQDCARYEPDLFVVYLGNNEAIGVYSPDPEGFNLGAHLWLLRAAQALRSLRLVQAIESLGRALRKPGPRPEQDMAYFRRHRLRADDPRRECIYRNFQANLLDICQAARSARAKVLLCTVAVNLGDCPPLASLHRSDLPGAQLQEWEAAFARGTNAEAQGRLAEAVAHYRAALALDDHFAELHYRLGRCHQALGQFDSARRAFGLARDWDALQFRTDSRLNAIIRAVAAAEASAGVGSTVRPPRADTMNWPTSASPAPAVAGSPAPPPGERAGIKGRPSWVVLVDVEKAFEEAAQPEGGIPGHRFFYEHVHLTFDGDYLLATTVLPAVAEALALPPPDPTRPLPTRAECAQALGFSPWDELGVHAAMVRSTAKAPFLDQLDHAQRQARAEAQVQQWRQQFQQHNGFEQSVAVYQAALGQRPDDWQIRFNYGNLLSDFGDSAGAVVQYRRAVDLMPVFPPLRAALAQALWQTGRRQEAVQQLQQALRWDPEYTPAKQLLGQATRRR